MFMLFVVPYFNFFGKNGDRKILWGKGDSRRLWVEIASKHIAAVERGI